MSSAGAVSTGISIHAAREGGDGWEADMQAAFGISIHAAREGGDRHAFCMGQSPTDISIHAAREGGDGMGTGVMPDAAISIHAAREGGDGCGYRTDARRQEFQSTPPVKAATVSAFFRFSRT